MVGILMKAIIQPKYGSPDVLEFTDVELPTPKDNDVRVRVVAASVTAADTMIRRGTPFYGRLFLGLRRPKHPIPGTGFAGEIDAVGKDVTQWNVGDQVFGEPGLSFGAHAEFVCMAADGLIAKKPTGVTYEEAASICDGPLTSFNFLTNVATVEAGQSVLINGAAGSLGIAAVQIAKHFGADVTGVCSANHFDLVKSLGADHVIDYSREDFAKAGKQYDIIFDTVGKRSFSFCKSALTSTGKYLSPVLGMGLLFQMLWTSKFSKKKAKFSATGMLPTPQQHGLLKQLIVSIEAGDVKIPIDRRYALDQIADAHRYIDAGHKAGSLAINVTQPAP